MTDDSLPPFDSGVASLLESEREAQGMPDLVRDRVADRLAQSLALPAPPSPTSPSAPSPVPLRTLLALRTIVPTFVVGGIVGAALYAGFAPRPMPMHAPTHVVTVRVEVPVAAPLPLAPVVAPTAPTMPLPTSRIPTPGPTAHHGDGAAAPSSLEAERVLVETARSALARGQPTQALAAIEQHAHRFPQGQLSEERDSLWVQALVARGDDAAARAQGARFLGTWPTSILRGRVEQALHALP